ncbi:MAG: NifU N-terminal domain-containing protein, partial [Actinobacteria bacterium]|nr:NifU N-terminal domain-containing protein [Actinomycetota bacterium]
MTSVGPELDAARADVVDRGLTPDAVGRLTGIVSGFSLESLAAVKQQLKRYFSHEPWTAADDEALAAAVGEGTGRGHEQLAPGLVMDWAFEAGRFVLRVGRDGREKAALPESGGEVAPSGDDLEATFDGPVVPEATPSPRTIRFSTPRLHDGPSRSYAREHRSDARVARLFEVFDEVSDVLVGPDFVAVTITRPDRWEAVLPPMLSLVTEQFAGGAGPGLERVGDAHEDVSPAGSPHGG